MSATRKKHTELNVMSHLLTAVVNISMLLGRVHNDAPGTCFTGVFEQDKLLCVAKMLRTDSRKQWQTYTPSKEVATVPFRRTKFA